MIFHFPYHTSEAQSRASSRESNKSNSSQRPSLNVKNGRSKIGDSPLTSKEFSINKITAKGVDNFGTFADNHKNGLNPSERMRKFNANQMAFPDSLNDKPSLMLRDYSKNSEALNNYSDVNGREAEFNSDQPKPGLSQNLRLLKTKMRLSSATSNESDVQVHNSKHDEFKSYRNNNEKFNSNFSEDFGIKQREGPNITVVRVSQFRR